MNFQCIFSQQEKQSALGNETKVSSLQLKLAHLDELVLTAAFQLELRGQLIIKLTQLHHSDIYKPKKIFLFLLGVRTFICLVTDQSPSCLLYKERFTNIFNEWHSMRMNSKFFYASVGSARMWTAGGQLVQVGLRMWIACDYCSLGRYSLEFSWCRYESGLSLCRMA